MTNSTPIIRPEITVSLGSEKITVRDLPWQEALEFLRLLAGHAKGLMADIVKPAAGGKVEVNVGALLPKLTDLITNASELSDFLLTRSTGKDSAWLAQRSTLEIFALLDAALEVNLSDGLLELGKKVGGRLGRVFAAKTSTTPPSAIS